MKRYLYLNLTPESLVVSMLSPEDYGKYMALGLHHRTNDQAIFAELDPEYSDPWLNAFDLEGICKPHPDGAPRKSSYLSIYRVLEHIPLDALKSLYLVTDDGKVLEIERSDIVPQVHPTLHLYQELAPMQPLVASSLDPRKFCTFITDRNQPVSVEKVAFCDLKLDELADDPVRGLGDNLPYRDIAHMRDCLSAVWRKGTKDVKVVSRRIRTQIHYRMIRSGFYIGNQKSMVHYAFPSLEELESTHYDWWRSAQF